MAQIEIKEVESIIGGSNTIIINGKTVYNSAQNINVQVIVHGDVKKVDCHSLEVHGSVLGDVEKCHNLNCEIITGSVGKAHNVKADTIVGDVIKAHNVSR